MKTLAILEHALARGLIVVVLMLGAGGARADTIGAAQGIVSASGATGSGEPSLTSSNTWTNTQIYNTPTNTGPSIVLTPSDTDPSNLTNGAIWATDGTPTAEAWQLLTYLQGEKQQILTNQSQISASQINNCQSSTAPGVCTVQAGTGISVSFSGGVATINNTQSVTKCFPVMFTTSGTAVAAGITEYFAPNAGFQTTTAESYAQQSANDSWTAKNLYCRTANGAGSGSGITNTFNFRKDGATALSCSISGSTSSCNDTTDTTTLSPTGNSGNPDLYDLQYVTGSGSVNTLPLCVVEFCQ